VPTTRKGYASPRRAPIMHAKTSAIRHFLLYDGRQHFLLQEKEGGLFTFGASQISLYARWILLGQE
jgi:hypothetical protein